VKTYIVTVFIIIISVLFANQAFAETNWVTFLPEYPEGTPPVVNVVTSDENHAVVEIITPGMWVEDIEEGGVVYDFLTLPECSYESEEGFPILPHVINTLGVPGEKGVYLNVLNKVTIELDDYFIWPVQLEQISGETAPAFYRNDYFYTLDNYYPPIYAGLGEASIWRDLRIVNPVLFPIRFNPAQRRLEVTTQIRYELTFDGPSENNVKPDPEYAIEKEYADAYRETVTNYDYLGLEETGWTLGEASYLILARATLHSHLQTLITWLSQKGFSVNLIDPQTLEGGNTAVSIKSAISKHYEGNNTKYVLLVGHANPNGPPATYIPTAILKPYYSPWYRPDPNDDIAYDYWYSLIDGNDMFPELAVGRIDLISAQEVAYAITKIINYEKNIVGGTWPKNSLLVADDDTWTFYPDPDKIKESIRKHDYVEPSPNFITCYGGEGKTNEYIESNINTGFGIVNYIGHGNRYGWADWNTSHES
jgi:hypothetical protein